MCTCRKEVMFHVQQSYFQHKGLSSGVLLAWDIFVLYIRFHVILEISASFSPHVQVMAVQKRLLILPVSSKNSFQQLMCHNPVFACRTLFCTGGVNCRGKAPRMEDNHLYTCDKMQNVFPITGCAWGCLMYSFSSCDLQEWYTHDFVFFNSDHVRKIRSGRSQLAIKMICILYVTNFQFFSLKRLNFY